MHQTIEDSHLRLRSLAHLWAERSNVDDLQGVLCRRQVLTVVDQVGDAERASAQLTRLGETLSGQQSCYARSVHSKMMGGPQSIIELRGFFFVLCYRAGIFYFVRLHLKGCRPS